MVHQWIGRIDVLGNRVHFGASLETAAQAPSVATSPKGHAARLQQLKCIITTSFIFDGDHSRVHLLRIILHLLLAGSPTSLRIRRSSTSLRRYVLYFALLRNLYTLLRLIAI